LKKKKSQCKGLKVTVNSKAKLLRICLDFFQEFGLFRVNYRQNVQVTVSHCSTEKVLFDREKEGTIESLL
jgi:hypothetical protein